MQVHYVILLLYVLEISNKFKNEREDSFEESLIKKKKTPSFDENIQEL